jgi:hypothetical protein
MLSPKFSAALAFPAELHRHQLRKGTRVPYVSQLLASVGLPFRLKLVRVKP